jgi:hypothetical protein
VNALLDLTDPTWLTWQTTAEQLAERLTGWRDQDTSEVYRAVMTLHGPEDGGELWDEAAALAGLNPIEDEPEPARTTDAGRPLNDHEEVWHPGHSPLTGFEDPFGIPVSPLQDPAEEREHPEEFLTIGHLDYGQFPAMVASAELHMQREHGWVNALDDETPGSTCALLPRRGYAVITRHQHPDCTCPELIDGQWWAPPARGGALDPDATAVTVLDLLTAYYDPDRLHAQVAHLRTLLATAQTATAGGQ